ncbi:MAG TPA: hypothetical protein VHZ76_10150 [Gammaproteobacteria bacterium]|nr:hypothetical protein [Gammaproteobacteria bacterium]
MNGSTAWKRRRFAPASQEDEKKERGNRIKYLMDSLPFSNRKFAKKYNINSSTLKNWLYGAGGGLTADGALTLIEAFKKEGIICTSEWLFYGKGNDPLSTTFSTSTSSASLIIEELNFFYQLHANATHTIITDNEMVPAFKQGDYVAGIRYSGEKPKLLINLECIIELQSGEILVRKLTLGDKPGLYSLISLNVQANTSKYRNIPIISAAYIIWIRRPLLGDQLN